MTFWHFHLSSFFFALISSFLPLCAVIYLVLMFLFSIKYLGFIPSLLSTQTLFKLQWVEINFIKNLRNFMNNFKVMFFMIAWIMLSEYGRRCRRNDWLWFLLSLVVSFLLHVCDMLAHSKRHTMRWNLHLRQFKGFIGKSW